VIQEVDKKIFPQGFLWGSATSSYQVEGGIENNDWAEAARKGKIPAAGKACDSYNLYEEDFDFAKSLGQNTHRLSIEWSRIEPEEGKFNNAEVEHYRQVLLALKNRGLEPFVTIWHFALPLWFSNIGGFENKKAPFYFSRYCEYVADRLGDLTNFLITINEPMVYVGQSYAHGIWPPFKRSFIKVLRVVDNLIESHNVAYKKIKKVKPNINIGIAADQVLYIYNKNPFNIVLSMILNWYRNRRFLSKIAQDFIGVNYYRPIQYGSKINFQKSDMDWDIYPQGIHKVLNQIKRYKRPIYITENGIADSSDTRRAKFIEDHLYWVWCAIQEGVDIRGYFYWSLLDNLELAEGFKYRFGLIEVDYNNMRRTVRQSAHVYKNICISNSLIPSD